MERKHLIYILALTITISIFTSIYIYANYAGNQPSLKTELDKHGQVTLIDDLGYVLNLTSYPERIVSLAPSNTEILFAVNAGYNVVGVTDWCDYPFNFTEWIKTGNISSVGSYWNPVIEPTVALEPDLILASSGSIEAANKLRNLGYNVLVLAPKDINGVLEDIILVGRATNRNAEAETLVTKFRKIMDSITEKVKNVTSTPKVYWEAWSDPLMAVGPNTFIDDMITLAGGTNIFNDASEQYPTVNSETVVKRNPDIIIAYIVKVKSRPGWTSITAVKNNQLYELADYDTNIFARPGPRLIDGLEIIAKMIHPSLFD